MKYAIEKATKKSAYLQLYEQLRNDIVEGIYPYQGKLPSKRLLAEECGMSVITVEHALSILCDEGYVTARERSGYFVTYTSSDFYPVAEKEPCFFSASPAHHTATEFPFSVFARTMRNVITRYGDRILIKSPNLGSPELRAAIASYLARSRGIHVTPSQVVIGSGAEYLYGMIIQWLGRECIYAVEDPSYDQIRAVYAANGVKYDALKMGKDGILTSELQRTKATVLHVTPFHSFPSGVTASASKRQEYVSFAKERGGMIIEDDFDSEFTISTKHEDTVFSLEPKRSVIYINTFSKTIAPSMRIGYMVLPKERVSSFLQQVGFYSCSVPVFEQYVLAQFIQNGDFERHINRVRRRYRKMQKEKKA